MKLRFFLVFFGCLTWAADNLHQQVLYTQVRVRAEKAGGSGTVVYSERAGDYYSTYILTCHHVIDSAIRVESKWDPLVGRDRKQEMRQPVFVEFFRYDAVPHGKPPLTSGATAEIVAYNARHDMALLHVQLAQRPVVAPLLPPGAVKSIVIGSPVVAVGCALLHDPILTTGIVTHQGDVMDYADYWMSNAQIIFGNSGGGMFARLGEEYSFIGIPSRVDVAGWSGPITHLGYFSPISRVYQFFEDQVYGFMVPGAKVTEAQCEAARKVRREADEKKALYMTVGTATGEKAP